jgi:hypothetical protein
MCCPSSEASPYPKAAEMSPRRSPQKRPVVPTKPHTPRRRTCPLQPRRVRPGNGLRPRRLRPGRRRQRRSGLRLVGSRPPARQLPGRARLARARPRRRPGRRQPVARRPRRSGRRLARPRPRRRRASAPRREPASAEEPWGARHRPGPAGVAPVRARRRDTTRSNNSRGCTPGTTNESPNNHAGVAATPSSRAASIDAVTASRPSPA